ncbi:MAG: hypothetical protein H0V89_08415 [Deltaproteobacteria bacterium]|nr:hypothetical protein [Deltaproteobacteria bacterium]
MIGIYLAFFLFGGVLIAASLLGGGSEHALDKDVGLDKDFHLDKDIGLDKEIGLDKGLDKGLHAAGEAGANLPWLPFLSLRFWTFGAASFGLTGLLLSALPVPGLVALVVALAVGLGVGTAAAALFRAINRDEVSGSISLSRYAGEEGRVVVTIRPGSTGRIAIAGPSGRVEIPAVTHDGAVLAAGDRILVASVTDGVADVSRLQPVPHPPASDREQS